MSTSVRKRLAPREAEPRQHVALIIEQDEQPLYLRRAPPPRPPLFLPDKHYQAFLQGRRRQHRSSWCDGQKCAKGCTGFSLVAILFLLFIGTLVDRQPLYIKGVRPHRATQSMSYSARKRHTVTASAPVISSRASQAAVAYLVTLVGSILYGWNVGWRIRAFIRRRHYVDIPDASSTIPTFHLHEEPYGGGTFWNRLSLWRHRQRRKKPKRG